MLGLSLVERRERPAAGITQQYDPLIAKLAQVADAGAEVLDRAFHDQRGVVAEVAGVQPQDCVTASLHRTKQIVAHEVAGRMDHHEDDPIAAAFIGQAAVHLREQVVQAALAVVAAAARNVDRDQLRLHGQTVSGATARAPYLRRLRAFHAASWSPATLSIRCSSPGASVRSVISNRMPFGSKK